MIATRLHRLHELGVDDPLLSAMHAAPKFVIAPDLLEVLTRPDIQTSIAAMIEAGIARLPYAPLLVEFSMAPGTRRFVLVDEAIEGFAARQILQVGDDMAAVSPGIIKVGLSAAGRYGLAVGSHGDPSEGMAAAVAVAVALLMLNIRGVEKTVIETDALNRARTKRGHGPVPQHTVVRIGTVYDRSGRAASAPTGRRMPVHLRAGHTRMQACGPERVDRKPIFIPPVLVNYRGEGDKHRIPQKVLAL